MQLHKMRLDLVIIFFSAFGLLFEVQRVFEEYLKIVKEPFSKENVANFEIFRKFKDALEGEKY